MSNKAEDERFERERQLQVSAFISSDCLERIADSLERAVIALDSIATALSLQMLKDKQAASEAANLENLVFGKTPPTRVDLPAHEFEGRPEIAYCFTCGAGRLHPIHAPLATSCVFCSQDIGQEHQKPCPYKGIVKPETCDPRYIDKP